MKKAKDSSAPAVRMQARGCRSGGHKLVSGWMRVLRMACVAALLAAVSACAASGEAVPAVSQARSELASVGAATTEPLAATPSATPAATASPTPVPTSTPAPTPAISDEWYATRTEELRKWMERYGGYSGAALDERVQANEIDPSRPMIALTFDDGPMEGVTDAIVRILAAHNCRATFFIRGSRMSNSATPGLLKAILGEGNELGNHTWGHEILSRSNGKVIMDTLRRTNEAVFDITGYTMHSMRPPGGYSSTSVRRYAKQYELAVVLWAQSGNVHEKDPERIAENVLCQIVNGKALEDGDIVLLHDTKPWMVEAVEIMVPQLLDAGYQLVTVSELLQLSERGYRYGEVYHKQNEGSLAHAG